MKRSDLVAAGYPVPDRGGKRERRPTSLKDLREEAVKNALAQAYGNRRKAAEILGIGEATLYRWLSKREEKSD